MVMHDKQLVWLSVVGWSVSEERCCLRILSLNIALSFQYEFAEYLPLRMRAK